MGYIYIYSRQRDRWVTWPQFPATGRSQPLTHYPGTTCLLMGPQDLTVLGT